MTGNSHENNSHHLNGRSDYSGIEERIDKEASSQYNHTNNLK
ncbi:hypothetical protein [Moellerella wisconsensis]|nr:hypothetical protein [Moellerella wisconsensis]